MICCDTIDDVHILPKRFLIDARRQAGADFASSVSKGFDVLLSKNFIKYFLGTKCFSVPQIRKDGAEQLRMLLSSPVVFGSPNKLQFLEKGNMSDMNRAVSERGTHKSCRHCFLLA